MKILYNDKSILAVIPARGNSKEFLRKNLAPFLGRPLLTITIDEAKKSKFIDRLILSSEDKEIIEVARASGCDVPFVRPAHLSEDDIPAVDVVLHAIDALPEKYDYIMMLQPTSPLRLSDDIDGCIRMCFEHKASSCVTVTEPKNSPFWMYTMGRDNLLSPLINQTEFVCCRQNLPKVYSLNGAVYIAAREYLMEYITFLSLDTIGYVMPWERSVDINTGLDLEICQYLFTRKVDL